MSVKCVENLQVAKNVCHMQEKNLFQHNTYFQYGSEAWDESKVLVFQWYHMFRFCEMVSVRDPANFLTYDEQSLLRSHSWTKFRRIQIIGASKESCCGRWGLPLPCWCWKLQINVQVLTLRKRESSKQAEDLRDNLFFILRNGSMEKS